MNLPDHKSLFSLLATNLEKSQTPVVVATLFSEHFTNVKNVIISMVSQLLNTDNDDESDVIIYFVNTYFIHIYLKHNFNNIVDF